MRSFRIFARRLTLSLVVAARLSCAMAAADAGSGAGGRDGPSLASFRVIGSDLVTANHLEELEWNQAQVAAFLEGVRASLQKKPYPEDDASLQFRNEIGRQVAAIESHEQEQEFTQPGRLAQYVKQVCKQLKLQQSDSGLCYGIHSSWTNEMRPGPEDTVVVSYTAFAPDGQTPIPQLTAQEARVKVSNLLPGFIEGLQMMTVGSQAIFILPPSLSFGAGQWPTGVSRGTPLLFRLTLHKIVNGSAAP